MHVGSSSGKELAFSLFGEQFAGRLDRERKVATILHGHLRIGPATSNRGARGSCTPRGAINLMWHLRQFERVDGGCWTVGAGILTPHIHARELLTSRFDLLAQMLGSNRCSDMARMLLSESPSRT